MVLQVKEADLGRGSPQLRGNLIFTGLEVLQRYLNDRATHAVCHACLPLTDAYQTIFLDVGRRGRNDAVTTNGGKVLRVERDQTFPRHDLLQGRVKARLARSKKGPSINWVGGQALAGS